ncbi:uncharacterized protein MELLADRAFT_70462 [Melampsora larici-populina 98AG31]|uniref:Elongin-A n=1 Tax=Melampsora larici-populina (strain 98AG31 / pathotype 3-4-7) TaxID=747676 RepID=F4R421_MELLP|nr:uncharacterized protein MELLADRAFT_70462 [Melampsora larici-populina 98AG31]EGG12725.1 hypothetical protein MELLADRAFT_70462 [Melampsora larici-populina 98AG31]
MLIPLKESCLRLLTAHSSGLKDVGNCVYELIRPVLFACPPDQLAEIEDLSPHLMLESDEIWLLHLRRDFPNESKPQATRTIEPEPNSEPYPTQTINPYTNEPIDLPIHRIQYFTIKQSKAKALANASARLRERTQANRSEFSKRKAIFTGETDRGQFRSKRLMSSNHRGNPYQSKSLAEKARQQVKKSCAVYANASRLKTPIGSVINPSSSLTRSIGSSSSSNPIHQTSTSSSSDQTTPRSHLQNPNIVVKVVPSKPLIPPNPSSRIIKPTPFQSTSKPTLMKVVRPINPMTPRSTKETIPIIGSSSNHQPTSSGSSGSGPSGSGLMIKKPSSLFMPKTKKPPPPTPLRSIVSVPLNQTLTSTRMSRPPPPSSSSSLNKR